MRARHRHFSHKAAGAVVAYDARYLSDSDGTALQTWPDRSGTYNATESDSTKRPLVKTGVNGINGQTALKFDGTNDDLQAASVPLSTYITVVICGSAFTSAKPFFIEQGPNANGTSGFYFYGTSGNSWQFRRTTTHSGTGVSNWFGQDAAIGSLRYGGSTQYRKNGGANVSNGTVSGTALSNTSTTNALNICSRDRSLLFSDGLLGSLAIYDGDATNSMLKRLEHSVAYSFKIACA